MNGSHNGIRIVSPKMRTRERQHSLAQQSEVGVESFKFSSFVTSQTSIPLPSQSPLPSYGLPD